MSLRFAVANDHAGIQLKKILIEYLGSKGIAFRDFGVNSPESVDYPDYARLVCESILKGEADRGLLVCGSGIGMSIAANKFPDIRCALIHDSYGAKMCREHNNANVIAFGERTTGSAVAIDALDIFITTNFLSDMPSHSRRVDILNGLISK